MQNESGEYYLYCKGADSVILKNSVDASEYQSDMLHLLNKMGDIGLRTLLLAERKIDPAYFKEWFKAYSRARENQ